MVSLTDLGFSKGVIVETILSTYNKDGQPNAAPMGTIMENEEQLVIKIFNSSLTYQNLRLTKCAVVNVTSNIDLFYKTAFKEANPQGTVPLEWFKKAQTVNAPQLCMAEATVETSIVYLTPIDAQRTQATFNVELINASATFPKVYCRAFAATLEAIVHATRVKAFAGNPAEQHHISKLLTLIGNCSEVVNRTAPNSQYSEIMTDLTKKADLWKAEK